jgi:hypothetical protein
MELFIHSTTLLFICQQKDSQKLLVAPWAAIKQLIYTSNTITNHI